MAETNRGRLRDVVVVAQDPSVRDGGEPMMTTIQVPLESLSQGPRGARVHVVDYDSSTNRFVPGPSEADFARFADLAQRRGGPSKLIEDPQFRASNAYAVVMETLSRFEFALGRRVAWSSGTRCHQLKVAPHAFADANAFYSEDDEALMFGYFVGRTGGKVYTCLAHDVVAHETTHALLDGLRTRYTDPSSLDQAAFHEAFADVVALLSLLSVEEMVERIVADVLGPARSDRVLVDAAMLKKLQGSALFGLGKQLSQATATTPQDVRRGALRRSIELDPADVLDLDDEESELAEPHERGEVLVAAMMRAFVRVWTERLRSLPADAQARVSRRRLAEEGAEIANRLLTISIRALDYAPVVDIRFSDFFRALLTADTEVYPVDKKYRFRDHLLTTFTEFKVLKGIPPTGWDRHTRPLRYDHVHFASMQTDADEVFRFVWENRAELELEESAYPRVISVRPCIRHGSDGFVLHETVVEYIEQLRLQARELHRVLGIEPPGEMPPDTEVDVAGGGVLVFDEFGHVKFHVKNRVRSEKQEGRIRSLWRRGHYDAPERSMRFANLHMARVTKWASARKEAW